MKKVLFLFLITPLLFSTSFEKPWNYDYWKYTNPHIITILNYEIWDSSEMHKTLESMDYESISYYEEEKLEKAILFYELSKNSKNQCELIGERAFSTEILLYKELIVYELAYKEVTESTISECLKYPDYWRKTMNYSIEVIDEKYDLMSGNCKDASEIYNDLEFSGLCEYSGEDCEELTNIVNNCEGDYYFGEFSDIYVLMKEKKEIKEELQYSDLNLSDYKKVIELFQSGINEKIKLEVVNGENYLELELQEIEILESEVLNLKNNVDEAYLRLEKHEIDKIDSGSVISGYLGGEINSVSLEFEKVKTDIEETGYLLDSFRIVYKNKNQGYLKKSFENLEMAKNRYQESYDELVFLEMNVEEIVDSKKNEAQEKINLFVNLHDSEILSSKTKMMVSNAEDKYYEGEKAENYGERYVNYRDSIKYINLAIISLEEYSGEDEILFFSELSNLKLIIENAEKDEINVEYEKKMIEYLENENDPTMLAIIEDLINGLKEKAEIKYGYLEEEREKIRGLIGVSHDEFGYYLSVLEDQEKGMFKNSKIEYLIAMGKLKLLEDKYIEIKELILFEMKEVLEKNLDVKKRFEIVGCGLDDCEIRIMLEINNPYNIEINNSKIEVETPFELILYKDDVVVGEEYLDELTVDGEIINLYFKKIGKKQTYYLVIKKNKTIIEINDLDRYSEGYPDGTAEIEYEYELESEYEVDGMELPELDGGIGEIIINERIVDEENGRMDGIILEGENELTIKTFEENGFEIEKDEIVITTIGLKKKISYYVNIYANIALDKINLILEDGYSEKVKDISIFSYSGHQIKNKKTSNSGKYSFEVLNIDENDIVKIRVEYLVDDPEGYLEEELKKIEKEELDEQELEILEEIDQAIDNNDSTTALEKLKELEKDMEKKQQNEYKLELKFNNVKSILEKELEEISSFLSMNISVDDEFIRKLEFRKEELENYLESYSGVSEENLTYLEEIDQKWVGKERKNFIKRIYSEYNKIKSDIIEMGFLEETSQLFTELEKEMLEFEVKGNLEQIPNILNLLGEIEEYKEGKENEQVEKREELVKSYEKIKEELENVLEIYSEQYEDSKGSNFEELFTYGPEEVNSKVNDIEKNINKLEINELEEKILELSRINEKINEIVNFLEKEANRRINEIEMLYSSLEMEEEEKEKVTNAILKLKEMNSNGEYLSVLKGAELVLKGEYEFKKDNLNRIILLIIITSLIVIILAYLIKDKIRIKKKKEFKKLKRVEP